MIVPHHALAAAGMLLAAAIATWPRHGSHGLRSSGERHATQSTTGTLAFVDVNVIPMDRERIVPRQTVIVRGDRIDWVGPADSARIPAEAVRIDGRDRFLMPGLAEMHAHVPPQEPAEQLLKDILFLYIANGVTTIRGMLGAPYQITLRERLTKGDLLGPTFYVAAPSLSGPTAPDPATASRLVRAHKTAGYDLLKLHPGLSRATYDSIVAVAREVGITWAGHVSVGVGIDHTLETRQSTVDHLDGYIEGAVSDEVKRLLASPTDTVRPQEIWRAVQQEKLRDLARRTNEAGVWNVPTMFLWETIWTHEEPEPMAARDEMKYAPKQWVTQWTNNKRNRRQFDRQMGITPEDARLFFQHRRRLLKALADAGAPLLMGTDSPQIFNVPGFALHRELRVMVESGLTPYQVLESGTKNVARYAAEQLRLDGRFGTVAPGNRADLVLLDANPLTDIGNLTRRTGVMVRGRWLPAEEIRKGLDELAARIASQ